MAYIADGTQPTAARLPRMRWHAVFAGWFVATGMAVLLYGGGIALGFSAFDPHDAQAAVKGLGIGTMIWIIVTWSAALFVGGLFASWFDGRSDETMGSLHGVTVWGVAVTASALWLALTLGQLSHRPAPEDSRAADSGVINAAAVHNEPLAVLRAHIHRATNGDAEPAKSVDADQAVLAALLAGHPDTARALLVASTGATMETANQHVSSWMPVVEAARDQIKSDADRVAHYSAWAMLTLLLSGLGGLVTAASGGWLGARHIHRVYHLRRYAGRPHPVDGRRAMQ